MRLILVLGVLVVSAVRAAAAAPETPKDFQPWNGAALTDWANAKKAIVISDMTAAEPSTVFSPTPKKGHWMTIPYEMRPDSGGHKGKAIWCGYESNPPAISIRPGVKGWHAIFVGTLALTGTWVKLDTDKASLWCSNGIRDFYVNSGDTFFKAAELSEQSTLTFSPQRHGLKGPTGITHVMLVPLTDAEIQRIKRQRADTSRRTMAGTHDGFSHICGLSPRTAEELLTEVEIYRHTDFGTFILHSAFGGDKTIYPSKVGHMPGGDVEDLAQSIHRHFIDSTQELARKNINPIKVLIDGAHDVGMKVHVGMRPAGWSHIPPYDELLWDTPFYLNNPQWRCVDRVDLGSPTTSRMSWAVPEVRKHMIDLLAEQVGFGADGAHMVFNRGFPLVLYEKAFCDQFKARHGIDPNEVKDDDPRIIETRADIVTTFFKELRAKLDEEEKRRGDGKHLEISAMVLKNNESNIQYGVDVRRLVKEKLLDAVYVSLGGFGVAPNATYDEAFFKDACESQGVAYSPMVNPPYDLKGQVDHAVKLYDGGAPGLSMWDVSKVNVFAWAIRSHMGHVDATRWRSENLELEKLPRQLHFFKWWGAQRMDVRYPPYWGG